MSPASGTTGLDGSQKDASPEAVTGKCETVSAMNEGKRSDGIRQRCLSSEVSAERVKERLMMGLTEQGEGLMRDKIKNYIRDIMRDSIKTNIRDNIRDEGFHVALTELCQNKGLKF